MLGHHEGVLLRHLIYSIIIALYYLKSILCSISWVLNFVVSQLGRDPILLKTFVWALPLMSNTMRLNVQNLRTFMNIDLLDILSSNMVWVIINKTSIATLAAFGWVFGVLSGLYHIVIINILSTSVDARATNKESISVLLAVWLLRAHLLLLLHQVLLGGILQATCSLVDFSTIYCGRINVMGTTFFWVFIVCILHLKIVSSSWLSYFLWANWTAWSQTIWLLLLIIIPLRTIQAVVVIWLLNTN